ncbi:NlpC/P60 family protein [Corynebacterium mendelii]|uniref:C40 family peptidase n=1 Tax=Corynebacterium mendelii TaxID=2765362 RepID=A0A939DZ36_9CORY|nr:C40 family peptidase [Corynebacterium mendelii]
MATTKVRRITRLSTKAIACAMAFGLAAPTVHAAPVDPGEQAIVRADDLVDSTAREVAALANRFADADARLAQLNNQLAGLRQEVNKALVDYSEAEKAADDAKAALDKAKVDVEETNARIKDAKKHVHELSRSAYLKGDNSALAGLAGQRSAKAALDASAFLKSQASRSHQTLGEMEKLRVEQANRTSELAAARVAADEKKDQAKIAGDLAEQRLETIARKVADAEAEKADVEGQRAAAEVRLQAAKANAGALKDQRREYREYAAARAEQKAAAAQASAAATQARQAADQVAFAEAVRDDAVAAAAAAHAAGGADAQEKQQRADKAVRAVRVAEDNSRDLAVKAQQAGDLLKTAATAVGVAAAALSVINDFTGAAGSSDSRGSRDGAADNPSRIDRAASAVSAIDQGASTIATAVETAGAPNAFDPALIGAADTALTAVAGDGNASQLAGIVGGAVISEPPAPTGTQAEAVQRANRANPGESYSLLQLYRGFDTVTPADLGLVTSDSITNFNGTSNEKVEAAIARAKSQLGMPYAWGGGNAAGPTRGIRDGGVADSYGDFNKIGFDCSGLVLYAFAGVGVALPHYTGYQYQKGTKIPISQIRRGDVLFWGPNAEYHTAIYLGNGQMIEAPQSGDVVKISPVRYSGITPYAVRYV